MILAEASSKDDIALIRKDFVEVRDDLKRDVAMLGKNMGDLDTKISGFLRELELRMTIKLGAMVAAAVAVIAAVQKLI